MPIRRFLNVLRVVFLMVFVVAIGARVVWAKYPKLVDDADAWVVATHGHEARRFVRRGLKAKAAGESEAMVAHFTSAAEATSDVKNGDRLEVTRRTALSHLRDACSTASKPQDALEWSQELHKLDERDTKNELARAKLLLQLGNEEEGLALLARLADLGQGSAELETPYFEALLRGGFGTRALARILESKGPGVLDLPLDNWEVRSQGPGKGWSANTRYSMAPAAPGADAKGSLYGATYAIETPAGGLTALRFDLPRAARVRVADPVFVLSLSNGTERSFSLADISRFRQLKEVDGGFIAHSENDPFFVIPVPDLDPDLTVKSVSVSAQLHRMLPEQIQSFLASPEGRRALSELDQQAPSRGTVRDRIEQLKELLHG